MLSAPASPTIFVLLPHDGGRKTREILQSHNLDHALNNQWVEMVVEKRLPFTITASHFKFYSITSGAIARHEYNIRVRSREHDNT